MKPFQRLQYAFAAHLRDPRRHKAPRGIEPRRLKIYTELFYNNVQGFLASAFPVLRRITPDARWHAMVRHFFARHESHQPLFHRIAEEFLRYLERERRAKDDPAFLRELAHYEWVELALSVAQAPPLGELADPDGDLMEQVPVVSPLAWNLTYQFAVHRIGLEFQPAAPPPQPTHLVVWRNREDEVKFM
ncbi:MAG: HvfC family RiPP maturation protein, partial [Nevskiaceae bacterium]